MIAKEQPKYGDSLLYIQGFPPPLKRKFKTYCASNGLTMKDTIISMIEVLLENPPSKKTTETLSNVPN